MLQEVHVAVNSRELQQIPFSQFTVVEDIRGGAFGELKVCRWNGSTLVVLKKNALNTPDLSSIMKDLKFLASLQHTRVACILGMCASHSIHLSHPLHLTCLI